VPVLPHKVISPIANWTPSAYWPGGSCALTESAMIRGTGSPGMVTIPARSGG
jgi:hypothetical protein